MTMNAQTMHVCICTYVTYINRECRHIHVFTYASAKHACMHVHAHMYACTHARTHARAHTPTPTPTPTPTQYT